MLALPALLSGCSLVGAAAGKAMSIKVKPSYTGLKGQTVGVFVSADSGLRNDFPTLQLDVARGVSQKLQGAQAAGVEELKGTQFPKDRGPEAMLAFQQNYPALMYEPMTQVAPKLGVSRLIYVEVQDFQTHPESVPELFRGRLSARVQVIEVAGGVGRAVYEERLQALFPENAPEQGLPDLGEEPTRSRTIDAFTTAVLQKFIPYEEK